jgi:general secretion pathway protein M
MQNFFLNLSKRDKNALVICFIFLVFFLAIKYAFLPALNKRNDLKRAIQTTKFNLTQMIELQEKYTVSDEDIKNKKDTLDKRSKNFSLFSYLDSTAEKCELKKNVVYMKPSFQKHSNTNFKKAFVKVKLESISLKACVAFFNRIENIDTLVSINSFSISTTGRENKLIDAVIETETIMATNL